MKILTTLMAVLILAGCTLTSHFDNNEYASLVKMEVLARTANDGCDVPQNAVTILGQLQFEAEFFHTYTKYRAKNEDTHQIAQIILDNINEMEVRYVTGQPSAAYCKLKTNLIATTIQEGLGAVESKVKP